MAKNGEGFTRLILRDETPTASENEAQASRRRPIKINSTPAGVAISDPQLEENETASQTMKQKALAEFKGRSRSSSLRRTQRHSSESCLQKSLTFVGPTSTAAKNLATTLRTSRLSHQPRSAWREEQHSRLYKVIVIGEVNTGKSALVRRYVHNFFGSGTEYRATLGVDFHLKLIHLNDEVEIRLQLWDIAGQERFCNMTRAYYKDAVGAFIVFDGTNSNSFEAVKRWKQDLDSKCFKPDGSHIPAILLCNKADLPRDPRLPSDDDISKFLQDFGFVNQWFYTSAKTGYGIQDAMNYMVRYVMAMDTWTLPLSSLEADEDSDLSLPFTSFSEFSSPKPKTIQLNTPTKTGKPTCFC